MSREDDDLPRIPSRQPMLEGAVGAGALAATPTVADAAPSRKKAAPYVNPLVPHRADPHIHRHSDGFSYFTATAPEYDRVILRRSRTLGGLTTAAESVIWRRRTSGDMGAHIWAPEIHRIGGRWYIYFAAAPAEDVWAMRIRVLESANANPVHGTWVERGRLRTQWETFSLDATTFTHRGTRCLARAQHGPGMANNTALWLSRMANPWTLTGPQVRLSDTTRQYGPGRNSFTVAEDGRTDVLVYHSRPYKEIVGDPLNDPNRQTRIQALGRKADGTPDFGVPVADTAEESA
ncbi:glycoside hydrolase family 43 protein [Streptomyces sp. NPDC003635]